MTVMMAGLRRTGRKESEERTMKRLIATLATFAALALGAPALATDLSDFPPAADKPIVIELDGVWNSFDTQARVDVTRGGVTSVGTTLDLEQLFGVPSAQVDFRGQGSWRFSKRNYLDFGYSALDRSGTRSIDQDIVWNGYTYKAGVTLDGVFNNSYGYIGWHYDIFRSDNIKVWTGLSVAYEHLETGLNGQATITNPDGTITKTSVLNNISVNVPAPLIGLGTSGAISKNFTFDFYVRAIGFNTSSLAANILEGGIGFAWYPLENFGLTLGVDTTKIALKRYVKNNETISASYAYAGPRLGLVIGF